MKSKVVFSINRLAFFAGVTLGGICPGIAQLAGQYGILDVTANGGINPNTGVPWVAGDQYRLAFWTANKFDAMSPDPAIHNARVTAQANLSNLGNGSISTSTGWTALITTTTTSVQENTGTGDLTDGPGIGGAGFPVYAMDGKTCIARNNADIWNSWSNPFDGDAVVRIASGSTNLDSDGNEVTASQNVHYSPFLNQYGLGDSATVHGEQIWTGSNSNGTPLNSPTSADQRVGSVAGVEGSVGNTNWGSSNANNTARIWNRGNQNNTTSLNSFYALSAPLTIVLADARPFVITIANAVDPEVGFTLEWPNKGGKLYRVLSSATLDIPTENWTTVAEDISSVEDTATLQVEPSEAKLFYIVEEYTVVVAE